MMIKAFSGGVANGTATCWRIELAQDLLKRGRSLKHIAMDVGYGSTEALSRAFKARTGQTMREWQMRQI